MTGKLRRGLKGAVLAAAVGCSASLLAAMANNAAPAFDSTPYPVAELGQTYRYAPHAVDPDGDTVRLGLDQGPAGMAFDPDAGELTWAPTAEQLGEHPVTVRADDGWGGSAEQSFVLHAVADYCEIYPITVPQPLLADAAPGDAFDQVARGTGAGNFSWLSWDGAVDAPTLADSLAPPGNSYHYRNPDNAQDVQLDIGDWAQGASGSMNANAVRDRLDALLGKDIVIPTWVLTRGQGSRFDYRVAKFAIVRLKDYRLTGNGWLSFEFRGYKNCYNDAPVAPDQALTTPEDVPLPFALQASDPEADPLAYAILQGPTHGRLEGDAPDLRYVPDPDYDGPDQFTYRVSDGEFDSRVATVSITVTPVNDAPVAQDQSLETPQDQALAIVLVGHDIDGDALAYRVVEAPAHGELSGSGDQWQYQPATGYYGPDQFRFVANDGELDSAPATVAITVLRINHPPRIVSIPDTQTPERSVFAYDLDATDPDPDDVLTYGLDPGVTGASMRPDDGVLAWTADPSLVAGVREQNLACKTPTQASAFDPVLKWERHGPQAGSGLADVLGPALVAQLTDDNGDGRVDQQDQVDVVVMSHVSGKSYSSVIALSGDDGHTLFDRHFSSLSTAGTPAIGDIDGDGLVEIAVLTGSGGSNMTVIENDGTVKWTVAVGRHSPSDNNSRDALVVADLDADGSPELIRGSTIVNNDGTIRCKGSHDQGGNANYAYAPIVADVDLDGKQELIAGRSIYDSQCQLIRQLPAPYDGYTAVGNFDEDPYPEIVLVSNGFSGNPGRLYLFKADGTKLFGPISHPGGGAGGPPTLANVDDDPYPEIGVAGKTRYALFDNSGRVLWSRTTHDYSSHQTGSTFFDFENDGAPEIVYGDEDNIFFWDGRTGAQRYKFANSSGTTLEYPVVADIDGDHSADVLAGFNGGIGSGIAGGIRVLSSASHSWPDARPLWNQHAFSITNINDDGTIPASPRPSWLASNTFRLNTLSTGQARGLPDLAVFDLRLDPNLPGSAHATVVNRGLAASAATVLRLYDGAAGSGRLLGSIAVPALAPNESFAADFGGIDPHALGEELTAAVDEIDTVAECVETNNRQRARLFHARATDTGGLYDRQVFSVSVTDVNEAPHFLPFTPATPHLGQLFTQRVLAEDPDQGDGLRYAILSGPVGMAIEPVSGELRWLPASGQTGASDVVVRVTDLRGLSATLSLTLTVPANRPPVITSDAPTSTVATEDYRYDLQASDADGDLLSYTLTSAPAGMTISGALGIIRWQPTLQQVGSFGVTARVSDPFGGVATQSFQITVTAPVNHPPVFDTTPATAVAIGQRYQYDARASDPDGDAVRFELLDAPLGMAIDTVTGTVVWQPGSDQIGEHTVHLRVSDGRGGEAEQDYTLWVSPGLDDGNHPPGITSTPATSAQIGGDYRYALTATDIDGDALSYALTQAPAGMTMDAADHVLRWTPAPEQAGLQAVAVQVSDGRGGIAEQSFTVLAFAAAPDGDPDGGAPAGNLPPTITSLPLTEVVLGQTYRYYPQASDPDGDALAYALATGPAGMSIDAGTGVIAWTPSALGSQSVALQVSDGRGGIARQSFDLRVIADGTGTDHLPVVTAPPATQAKVGQRYCETLRMVDPDGDAIAYALVTGPSGASIDAVSGEVCWTPDATGTFVFVVRATSGQAYVDTQWSVTVVAADTPLSVQVSVAPERVLPGAALTVTTAYSGAAGPVTINATLGGQPIALDLDGSTSMTAPTAPGYYALVVTVGDGVDSAQATADLYIADSGDTTPPTVAIQSPASDGTVTAPTSVMGYVHGADVARWTLRLIDKASGAANVLAQGAGPVDSGALAPLDPTLSLNGFHTLLLEAWDKGGNHAQDSRTVLIDGDMKLGNFSLTFEDVSLPLGGLPIRVTRTYDTRRRNESLAFGKGWSVDYQSLRLTESRTPGYAWSLVQERNGYFGNWCVRPNGDPIVAVTLPDGKLMKFRAKASPECQFLTPQTDVKLVFEALPGTDAQLDQTDFDTLRLATVAGSNVYNLMDLSDPYQAPADPSHYRLKLPDGTVYSLTQGIGITKIVAPDGNSLTYSRDGIQHSLGAQVKFIRDGLDRIEAIELPDGQRRHYVYTAAGDLEMALDEVDGITSFSYLPQAPHYLRDIVDPRGVRVSRNEYDDAGRLIATIDADGHRIEYTHNLAGRTEIIKDRRGNASVYAYDERGRVVAEANALGETTLHSYDEYGNELSTTDPLGHVTTRVFDARANLLEETDPLGGKTRRTYNERNEVLTMTDPLGRVVATNSYNAYNGKLVSIVDASGAMTTFGYDSGLFTGQTGELTGIVDAENNTTVYEVNQFGFRSYEYDPYGNMLVHVGDLNGREHGQHRTRTRSDGTVETLYTNYTLDAKGRITATRHPDGSVTTTDYDGNDKPIRTCDGLNRCTVQEYNARGELARTTYPDGTWESSDYDENGNVVARTDRGGRTTKMVYDAANRLTTTILPDDTSGTDDDNPRTSNEYDAAGRMIASVDANGHRTEYGYDDAGRRTTVTDALGHVTTTAYDPAGQRLAVTDALGRTTRFEYDLAGRLVATVFPDDTAFDDDNPRVTITYDKVGRKLTETDEMGRTKAYAYDALGRLVSVRLPNPSTGALDDGALVTRYGYDEVGNKLTQTDALGRVTRWSYDAMGRELSRTLPLGQVEHFGYDTAGQRVSHTDFKGVTTYYGYDAAGRLESVDYPHDPDVITTYTASGQRATVTDGQGTTTYAYDARDQLRSVTTPDGNTVAYDYDPAGNRTGLHSPALDQAFDFDELNRLHAVHSRVLGGSDRVATYEYDAVGNRAALTQANGVRSEYGFDVRNRLRSLVTRTAAGAMLFAATYTVDASGLRTGIDEANAAGPTRSVAYGYDADRRLLAETIAPAGGSPRTTTWTYDAVGNRLEQNHAGTITTYTVDANDRLVQTSTGGNSTIYTYDANGNTTGQAKAGAMTTYGYDEANRQTTVTTAGATTTLAYNADGLRIAETAAGRTTTWLLDPNRDYAQTLEASTDGNLATVWEYGDELLAQSNVVNGGLHETALHTDGLGSVRQATDVNANETDSFEYDAFGNELARTGTTDIDHRYRSEQVDPNTGFYNLRARWMDPGVGRFTTQDEWIGSAVDPISLHKYLYSNSNPENSTDPSGHFSMSDISMGQLVRSTLSRAAIGSVTGGILNGADAYIAGDDVGSAVVNGMVFGAMLGPLTGINALKPILSGLALSGGAYGMYDAYTRGDTDLLAFRSVLFVAGPTFFLRGMARPSAVPANSLVYRAFNPRTGEVIYVGITDNFESRAATHLRQRGFRIEAMEGLTNLSRPDSRNVEQALIEYYGLGRNGGTLLNKINSIAVGRKSYSERIMRGYDLLKKAGYPEGDGWW